MLTAKTSYLNAVQALIELVGARALKGLIIFCVSLFSILLMNGGACSEEVRYRVDGSDLYFNMDIRLRELPLERGLNKDDVEDLSLILMENAQIKRVVLTGRGGMGEPQIKLSEKIITFELDTAVQGRCNSACAQLFLAGKKREILKGGKIGFHSPHLVKEGEKRYYTNVKDKKKWKDEFDYVLFIYERGYLDAVVDIQYMTSRGVSLEFAIKALKVPSDDIWQPTLEELKKAGVVNKF